MELQSRGNSQGVIGTSGFSRKADTEQEPPIFASDPTGTLVTGWPELQHIDRLEHRAVI
jgi:hypothetical protein